MAEMAGLALSIVATADLCLKYGKILKNVCETFRGAQIEIDERIIRINVYWKRTSVQLDFIKQIWRSLDEELRDIHTQILRVLVNKLIVTNSKIEKLIKKKSEEPGTVHKTTDVKKWKYVLVKESLDEAIESLASWQELFDPSWFLIMKISHPLIDQELSRDGSAVSSFPSATKLRDTLREEPHQKVSVFLPEDGLLDAQISEIPYTTAKCVQRSGSDTWLVVDSIPCDPDADIDILTKDVRQLATRLSSMNPFNFGILQSRGVVKVADPKSGKVSAFDFVFRIPSELGHKPQSLRSILLSNIDHTLTDRIRIAKQLAKSISSVHTLGFVHKNVRPETILGFAKSNSLLGLFVLIGFEKVRMADGRTNLSGDSNWERNFYRHPHRQGLYPEETYTMQHDIYSLGVCLLEIGLWESFVLYSDDSKIPTPTPALGIDSDSIEFRRPILMKEYLVSLAKEKLPRRVGERYTDVVVNCLTCLDEENADFGNQRDFEDEDGVLVGVRYIEKILLKLEEISV